MSTNATEVNELLLQVLSTLATVLNASSAASSSDPDSLASPANRLALAAVVLAVAAFVIATLQALLEYSGSGESARRRCNFAAVGHASQHVRKRWSLRAWRRKFYYPDTVLTHAPIFANLRVDGGESQLMRWFGGLLKEMPDYKWSARLQNPTAGHIT
jgi:hypothetical protein